MPEGVVGYPRWQGALATGPAFLTIAAEDAQRALRNTWSQMALILAFAYAVFYLGSLNTIGDARGDAAAHTWENFTFFLGNLRWAAIAVAAVMAGPALLEDARRGALELYLSRGLTHRDYLAGKVLAVVGLTFLAFIGPALVYVGASYALFGAHPAGWERAAPGALGYGAMLALLFGGLGLGLSCLAKSSRAATLMLFGGIIVADVFVASLLTAITRQGELQILSPLAALAQQTEWLLGVARPYAFETWWGIAEVAVLTVLGWALVAWKHPRLAGEVR